MCVQRFDDSLNSAIHITYRISLRSSSMREPRDPLLKVLILAFDSDKTLRCIDAGPEPRSTVRFHGFEGRRPEPFVNDPSAGSPTETLLRLLLPLNDQV